MSSSPEMARKRRQSRSPENQRPSKRRESSPQEDGEVADSTLPQASSSTAPLSSGLDAGNSSTKKPIKFPFTTKKSNIASNPLASGNPLEVMADRAPVARKDDAKPPAKSRGGADHWEPGFDRYPGRSPSPPPRGRQSRGGRRDSPLHRDTRDHGQGWNRGHDWERDRWRDRESDRYDHRRRDGYLDRDDYGARNYRRGYDDDRSYRPSRPRDHEYDRPSYARQRSPSPRLREYGTPRSTSRFVSPPRARPSSPGPRTPPVPRTPPGRPPGFVAESDYHPTSPPDVVPMDPPPPPPMDSLPPPPPMDGPPPPPSTSPPPAPPPDPRTRERPAYSARPLAPNKDHVPPSMALPKPAQRQPPPPKKPATPKITVRKPMPPRRSRKDEEQAFKRVFVGCGEQSDYDVTTKLGEGTFGEVHKAIQKSSGRSVALKRILMHHEKEGMPVTALREIKILKALKHPCIIDIVDMFVVRSNGKDHPLTVIMVFPYMDHDLAGLLDNERATLQPSQVKLYMKQLLEGTEYMHRNGILHRDMKAANLLIGNNGSLKIADFGLARAFDSRVDYRGRERKYTNCVVTRWYRPPELLMGARHYGGEVDMWGIGCVLGEMFTRRPILPGTSDADQLERIWDLCGTPTQHTWPNHDQLPGCEGVAKFFPESKPRRIKHLFLSLDGETIDMLESLLMLDPSKRITAAQALDHTYFWTDPLPADPKTLATYEPSHELDKRGQRMPHQRPTANAQQQPVPQPPRFNPPPPYNNQHHHNPNNNGSSNSYMGYNGYPNNPNPNHYNPNYNPNHNHNGGRPQYNNNGPQNNPMQGGPGQGQGRPPNLPNRPPPQGPAAGGRQPLPPHGQGPRPGQPPFHTPTGPSYGGNGLPNGPRGSGGGVPFKPGGGITLARGRGGPGGGVGGGGHGRDGRDGRDGGRDGRDGRGRGGGGGRGGGRGGGVNAPRGSDWRSGPGDGGLQY